MACFILAGSIDDSIDLFRARVNTDLSMAVDVILRLQPGDNLPDTWTPSPQITSIVANWKSHKVSTTRFS